MHERQEREPVRLELLGGIPTCTHHWVLEEPSEGWVNGTCRTCGGRKQFPASPESTQRFDDYREITAATAYNERLTA
jgi:hypothetical protein